MVLLQESDPSFYTLVKQRDFQWVDLTSLYPWPLFSFANFSKRRLSQALFFIKFEDKNRLLLIFTSVSRGHPVSSTLNEERKVIARFTVIQTPFGEEWSTFQHSNTARASGPFILFYLYQGLEAWKVLTGAHNDVCKRSLLRLVLIVKSNTSDEEIACGSFSKLRNGKIQTLALNLK